MPSSTPSSTYVIALGSNRPGRHGPPEREIAAALAALGGVRAASPIVRSAALGPSARHFANMVAILETGETPPALLARLKAIERAFGRRRGRRWGGRVLDLDIILWSGGAWSGPGLVIPHPRFRERAFVLGPLAAIAPDWRDPITSRTIRQLRALLDRPRKR
ncbi:MAG: 2-amino-4-hydroxy-6-hydroxymethyldihydropteridine diphosphokinase [Sphingomonas sp.]